KCRICKRIFCCAKCRQKHQFNAHAIVVQPPKNRMMMMEHHDDVSKTTIYVFCPICEQKPLTLHKEMYAELLAHIENVHLPLRCRKCLRHYSKIDDLLEFSKCVDLSANCSRTSSSSTSGVDINQSCDTDASKATLKKSATATVAISTQTSPCIAKDLQDTTQLQQQDQRYLNLTPISLFNLRWKAKSRVNQEEFISDSVSSIRNLSTDSVNLSLQRRSIGHLTATATAAVAIAAPEMKGKVIRSTSTPLHVCSVFAKPKETLTFNASSGGGSAAYMSSIYHSGYVLDEHNTPAAAAPASGIDSSQQLLQPQRAWKMGGRGKMSAVTPLRQVMSKSIQKAFVELNSASQVPPQRRVRLDLSETAGTALDLRLSPVVRRTQSEAADEAAPPPFQILTTESIIITRTQHAASRSNSLPVSSTSDGVGAAATSSTSTVYNSCESVEIVTSSSASASLACELPPITPITRIPGAIITKKLIKFETPHKSTEQQTSQASEESPQEDKDIFYTPNPGSNPGSPTVNSSSKDRRRHQIVPRQLSDHFANNNSPKQQNNNARGPVKRPLGPRARPPLHDCHRQKTFSCVQDVDSDEEYQEEVFLPNSASTHNDIRKRTASTSSAEPGRLWSLMSSMMRLPATFKGDADKENAGSTSTSGSLIRRCASIAGSLVRTMHGQDEDRDVQSMKRKRTQTLDSQYSTQLASSPSSSSSKRLRIQPRKPIERMRTN
ncbi:hypothetical protein KR044_002145, partial [Drosophila immigrans]